MRCSLLLPVVLMVSLAFLNLFTVSLAAQEPRITRINPGAVNPASATTLRFQGENLQGITKVWTSFRCLAQPDVFPVAASDPPEVDIRFTLASGVSPGVGVVRLLTTNGISDVHWLLIDDLLSVVESETNRSIASAQNLSWPIAVDGFCAALAEDVFKISARRGQLLSVEVVAQRLGSPLDSLLRIVDANQREIAYGDDDPRVETDSRVSVIVPHDGDYWIHLRDSAYAGGPNHRYRLRIGSFALCSMAIPSETPTAELKPVILRMAGEPLPVPSVNDVRSGWTGILGGAGEGAVFVRTPWHDPEVPLVLESGKDSSAAQAFSIPATLYGRFEESGDRDLFQFEVKAGQTVVFHGQTRSLGSPCDLLVQLQRTNGTSIATAGIGGALQGTLTNQFKDDGTYILSVEELNNRGGSDLGYRIDVQATRAHFDLEVDSNKLFVAPGETFELKVKAVRHGYTGPICLEVRGLEDQFPVQGAELAENKDAVSVVLRVPEAAAAGDIKELRVIGRGNSQQSDRPSIARWTKSSRDGPTWWNEMPWNEVVVLGVK